MSDKPNQPRWYKSAHEQEAEITRLRAELAAKNEQIATLIEELRMARQYVSSGYVAADIAAVVESVK